MESPNITNGTELVDSTAVETITLLLPVFMLSYIVTTVSSLYSLSQTRKFICEFVLMAVPTLFSITILADSIIEIIVTLVVIATMLRLSTQVSDAKNQITTAKSEEVKFITNVRAVTSFVTGIAILAVDFKIFPVRFRKNDKYGFSLMDLGVGLFIYSNGIVASELKRPVTSMLKVIRDCVPLLLLGVARFLTLKEIDYKVSELEYGVHWNFFLTLAMTKILCSLILKFISAKHSFIIAAVILTGHEYMLQNGLANFVFTYENRDDFISANREGIVSCFGYVGLYFLCVSIGILLKRANAHKNNAFKSIIILLTMCLSSLCGLVYFLNDTFGISRRLANSGYCIWVTFVGVFVTLLFYVAEVIQTKMYKSLNISNGNTVPYIFKAINYNGLAYFLVANLLTGLVNIIFDTLKLSTDIAITILFIYLFLTNLFPVVLYNCKIKLKI